MKRRRATYVTEADDPLFGRKAWSARYDSIDRAMARPIHKEMSVAPPWAKRLTGRMRRPAVPLAMNDNPSEKIREFIRAYGQKEEGK